MVEAGIPFVNAGHLQNGQIDKNEMTFITKERFDILSGGKFQENDILFCLRGSLGKSALVKGFKQGAIASSLVIVRFHPDLDATYFIDYFDCPLSLKMVRKYDNGTAQPNLSSADLAKFLVPLPPLKEQHRIVAKVDELMALCDQLEAQHSNAAEAHEKLVNHLLGTLTQSQSAHDFNVNWQRIGAHFDTLFTTEASIDALKQTLLQLAVMGKLVPQDVNDEPASELLKRIQAEKAKLVAEGKIKKENPLASIGDDEKPFELPKTWEWVRIGTICRPVSSGSTPSAEAFRSDTGIPFLKVYNIRNQQIDFEYKPQFIDESLHQTKLKRSVIYANDIVMNIVGPPLGKVAIIPDTFPEWNCNQAIVFFGLIKPMSEKYVLNYFKESSYLNYIELIGTAGQDNISVTKSKNILLPIPPLNEQQRIVAKVDELMTLCDQLKTRIQQANQQQQAIANTLVAQAVQPTAEIINLADYRAATACYAITKMQGKSYFGRTAAMKVLYLAEAHLGLPLNFQPMREAAGPLDKWIYAFEKQGEHEGWFKVIESEIRNSKTKIEYQVKSAIAQKSVLVEKICSGEQLKEFDRLLGLIADKTTEEAEIIATLFAAWNDFLIDGRTPSDDEIVKEVRENWHKSKARFTAMQLKESLNWMRRNHLVPKGRQPRTVYQQQLITS